MFNFLHSPHCGKCILKTREYLAEDTNQKKFNSSVSNFFELNVPFWGVCQFGLKLRKCFYTINIVQESILYCRRRRHLNGNFLYGKEVILSVLTFLALKKCKINVLPYLKPQWLGFLIILLFLLQVHSLTARSVSREFRENLKADKPKVTDTIGKLLYF